MKNKKMTKKWIVSMACALTVTSAFTGINTDAAMPKKNSYSTVMKKKGYTGWKTINGKKYYYKNGQKQRGIQTINGKRYYFRWYTYDLYKDGWLYMKPYKNYVFCDTKTGEFLTGPYNITGTDRDGRYTFDKNGFLQANTTDKNGWRTENGKKYYYKNGQKQRGIQTINGKRYYFRWYTYDLYKDGWLYMKPYKNYVFCDTKTGEFLTGTYNITGTDRDGRYTFDSLGFVKKDSGSNTEDITDADEQALRNKIVRVARSQLGVPYKRGTKRPGISFDCSLFVQYVFEQVDYHLPGYAYDMAYTNKAKTISAKDAKPGDLVCWPRNYRRGHVGIYLGNGRVIHATSNAQDIGDVRIDESVHKADPRVPPVYRRIKIFN